MQRSPGRIFIALHLQFIFLFSPDIGLAQQSYYQVKSPQISISEWVGAQPPTISGKTLVLEFWATWCGGCIEAMPHINAMAERFGSDNILFISINAYDKRGKIEKFLERNPLKTLVAIDLDRKTTENFQVQAMPQTFLIDKNGWLRWRGVPGLLTESFLQSFLAEDKVILPSIGNPLLYSCNISIARDRTVSSISVAEGDKYGIIAQNRTIRDMIYQLTAFLGKEEYEFRITGKVPLEPALDVEVRADSSLSEEFVYADLLERIVRMFGGTATRVKENVEIWYMTVVDEALLNQAQSRSEETERFTVEESGTGIHIRQIELFHLPSLVQNFSGKTVKGALSQQGHYDIILPLDFGQMRESLEKKYGLRLEKQVKEVEVEVFEFK